MVVEELGWVVDALRILLERVVDEQGTVPGTVDGLSVRENDAAENDRLYSDRVTGVPNIAVKYQQYRIAQTDKSVIELETHRIRMNTVPGTHKLLPFIVNE